MLVTLLQIEQVNETKTKGLPKEAIIQMKRIVENERIWLLY